MKNCKYCQSEIDEEAKVCPVCRRTQSIANHPLWLIPILIIVGLFLFFIYSPNAPISARKVVCGLGLREGYPYCSIPTGEYEITIETKNLYE